MSNTVTATRFSTEVLEQSTAIAKVTKLQVSVAAQLNVGVQAIKFSVEAMAQPINQAEAKVSALYTEVLASQKFRAQASEFYIEMLCDVAPDAVSVRRRFATVYT